jgi:uridine phosphorylase
MEMSTLYVIAAMRGVRAGGILTVDGNLVEERDADMSDYDPHRAVVAGGVTAMLEIAVDAAADLAGESA